jgi:hypothetical protein
LKHSDIRSEIKRFRIGAVLQSAYGRNAIDVEIFRLLPGFAAVVADEKEAAAGRRVMRRRIKRFGFSMSSVTE